MVNVNKLKGTFVEKGYSTAQVADGANIVLATLYRRMRNPDEFTIGEASAIANFLSLSANEATAIFFSESVA
jgi:hypothetical protein